MQRQALFSTVESGESVMLVGLGRDILIEPDAYGNWNVIDAITGAPIAGAQRRADAFHEAVDAVMEAA